MNHIYRKLFFIIFFMFALLSFSCTRQSALTFHLVHPDHDEISHLAQSEANIDKSQYEFYVKDKKNYWVNKNIELDLNDIEAVKIKIMIKYPYEEKWEWIEVSSEMLANYPSAACELVLSLNEQGQKRFKNLTKENVHRRLAILFENKLLMAPVIREEIDSSSVVVSGIKSDEARYLKDVICQSNKECKANIDVSANISLKSYDPEKAIKYYKEEIAKHPEDAMHQYSLGEAYKAQGNHREALLCFDKAIKIKPDNVMAYYQRGMVYEKIENFPQAIKDLTQAIDNLKGKEYDPLFIADIYQSRGFAYWRKNDYDGAIADYNQAIELNPHDYVSYHNRGIAYREKGHHDLAVADYNKAIELNPGYALAYHNRGFIYTIKGDYSRAIADYDKAVELNPKDNDIYLNRGNAYGYKGDYDQAIIDYNKALELNPKDDFAYENRGLAYSRKADYDRAISDYTKAIELNPKYRNAYSNRGTAYLDKGDYDRAIADYNKAIELAPEINGQNYVHRGYAYFKKNDHSRAISDYSKAIEVDPTNVEAYTSRSVAHYFQMNKEAATIDLQKAISLVHKKKDSWDFYNIACAYAQQEKIDEACQWLKLSFDAGFKDWAYMNKDTDLSPIRNASCYKELTVGK